MTSEIILLRAYQISFAFSFSVAYSSLIRFYFLVFAHQEQAFNKLKSTSHNAESVLDYISKQQQQYQYQLQMQQQQENGRSQMSQKVTYFLFLQLFL